MDPLLCFPADLPAEVTLALQSAGLGHHGVTGPDERGGARTRRAHHRATRARWWSPATT